MEKYLVDLFVASAQEQMRAPKALLRLYLSLFSPPLGKTLRLDMVKDMLTGQDLHGKRVLDVGCGIGDLSFLLAQRGAEVIGVELDEQKVARASSIARKWHFTGLRFLATDVTKLDQMSLGQFDAIVTATRAYPLLIDVAIRSGHGDFVADLLRRSNDFDLARRYGLEMSRTVTGTSPPISPRERQVLELVAEGRTNEEVAGLLFISPVTVKAHLGHIYEKLGVRNRVEAVARLRSLGPAP